MKRILLLGFIGLMGLMGHVAQAQMMIDTWAFSTGVDTTLWMDLGEDYTTLFACSNGYQNIARSWLRDIGFPFTLGTTTHTKFSTNVNGTVRLGSMIPSIGYIDEPLGQNINAGPRIDALGRAAMIDTSCYMRSAVLGDSGSRVLVVEARLREYADMSESEGHYVHFQVQLFEAGGLRVVYGQVDPDAIYGSTQNGVAATGNSSNKDVVFFDFAEQRAVRFNGNCTLRNAAEVFPTKGRWYMMAPDPGVCPWPSTVTIPSNPDAGGVLLTRIAGDSNTMRVMIHAMDIDTVWEGTESTMVLPPVNPATNYTLSLQTLCGSDTSYRTRDINFFSGCGAVVRLPWETTFATLSYSDCWDMPYVSGNNADFSRRWRNSQTGDVRCPSASGTYNSWLKAPVFYLPDTDGITLKWDYKAMVASGVSPHVELRVAPCDAEGAVASDAEWVTVWTSDVEVASYATCYANLDLWRGQRVRVAFVRTGEGGGTAYIDNVMLYQQQVPVFEWATPTVVHTGDTAMMSAAWLAGVDSNVTWNWHSALLDTTVVIAAPSASMVPLVYTASGWDTVTLTVSNVYGSDSAQAVVDVVDCGTITAFPWMDDFTHSADCWDIDGWTFQERVSAYDAGYIRYCSNVYYANNTGKYMLMQPVAVPATGAEHLSLWVESDGPLMVRVSPTASLDTATYTDTLLIVPDVSNRIEIRWRTVSLSDYAGQTVRVGFFKMDGTQVFVSAVKVDYDTLPVLGTVSMAARSRTDSTNVCRAELRFGATDGLTFTWHSSLMDTTIVTTGSTASIAPIAYTVGGWDTITVVVSNAYGADTAVRVVQVMDCHPVHALPWREEFDDGLDCWYLTQNNTYHQWQESERYFYVNNIYHQDFYAASRCDFSTSSTTPADAWMVSRAITLPADTALAVRLFWEVAIFSGNNLTNNYRVMVSTAADCTDTTLFEELYRDTLPLPYQTNFAQRSVSLAAYAGQTVFIAFRNQPSERRATALMIDKVEVRATVQPKLELAANNDVFYYGDTATFVATMVEGSDSGLVYTWHSSLLDSTWTTNGANPQCSLTYGLVDGADTVTVVATNAYGSDTASVAVTSTIITEPTVYLVAEGHQFPPKKAVAGDTVVYCATRNRCVTTGMTYLFHSSLMDTTVTVATTADTVRLPLFYPVAGIDTFTVTLSNIYDTSLTVPFYMTVLDCPPVSVPYMEDFESMTISYVPDCWDGGFWVEQNNDGRGAYFFEISNDAMLISPLIDLPADSLGLQLSWVSDYTFYINADVPSKVFVSPTGGKRDEDFTDTLYTGALCQRNGTGSDSVLLDAYRGSQVRIAFPSIPNTTCLYDNIRIDYNRTAPQVSLDMPGTIKLHDTVLFTATINACSPQGLSVSWHSTLMGTNLTPNPSSSGVGSEVQLAYAVAGVDTIMVIVANAYGADTAVAVVRVIDCSPFAVPYSEDFEGMTATLSSEPGNLVDCWDYGWNGSNAAYAPHVIVNDGYQYFDTLPSQALFMVAGNSTGYGNQADVLLPRFADSLQTLSIAFDYCKESANIGTLTVGYYDGDTFTALQTLPPQSQTYRRDTVSFASATVPDGRIGLRWTQGGHWYAVAIDNIEVFRTQASFFAPRIAIAAPATILLPDSATYSITLNDWCSPDGLSFTWHSTLLDSTIVTTEPMLALSYTAGGIDTVTVVASNAYGADTAVAYLHVVDCNGAMLPYVETFEGVTPTTWDVVGESHLPFCWETTYNGTNGSILLPTVVNSYQYITGLPDNALLLIAGGGSVHSSWVQAMLPRFSLPLSSLVLSLDYRHESAYAGTLMVGYVDDTLGFFPVDTLTPHQGSYTRDTVYLAGNVASYDGRIALRFAYNASFYGVVIDNIEVVSGNGIPTPLDLTVDSVDAFCASFSWSAADNATAYVVAVEGVGDTVVSGTAVTFCGLNQESDYSVKVAAIIGGDTGFYTPNIPFSTLPYCASPTDVTISADGVITWQYATSGILTPTGVQIVITDTATGAVVVTDTVYGNSYTPSGLYPYRIYSIVVTTLCGGVSSNSSDPVIVTLPPAVCYEVRGPHSERYRFIDSYSSYNYNQMLYPASMVGTVDTLYGIAFRVSGSYINHYRNVDIYLGHITATSISSPVSATNLTQVADNHQYSIADTGWSRILFDTPFVYDGSSNLIVTMVDVSGFDAPYNPGTGMHAPQAGASFLTYSKVYSSQPTPDPYTLNFTAYSFNWIPDIQLLGGCDYDQCLSPWVSVSGTTTNSATLSWQQRGHETLWQVEYRADSNDPWIVADTTTATTYTLAGLSAGSTYQMRVASLCGGDTLYGDSFNVSTDCDTVSLPFHTDFTLGYYPCWITGGYVWETFPGIHLIANNSSYDSRAISPAIGTALSSVKVTVRALNPNNDSYYSYHDAAYAVGVCDAAGANVVWIDTVPIIQRHVLEERTVFLHNYSGNQRHIIVRPVYGTTELHSITLDAISGCLPVHDVWVSQLTDNSATLQWEPESDVNTFAVYLNGALLGIATGTSWPLTSLTPSTQYNASVREICGAGDTAMAINRLFQTACAATSLPYFEGFGNGGYQEDISGVPDCWTLRRNSATAYYDPELHLYSSPNEDSRFANFVCSPLLNVGPWGGTVRFKGKAGFAGVSGNVLVGVMTNISDTSSFIPVVTLTPVWGNPPMQWYEFNTDSLGLPDVWAFAVRWAGGAQGAFDSLSIEANPVVTHTLSLSVNDTTMGSVSGAGTYVEGTTVTVSAEPNPGYRFVVWSDSVTEATRQVSLRSDTSLTAYFEALPDTVWRTVSVAAEPADICETYGSGRYADGSTVEIGYLLVDTATSGGHWAFTGWSDGSTDNPRQIAVTSDTALVARFEWVADSTEGIGDSPTVAVDFDIYPNPATVSVTVQSTHPGSLVLMDVSGRVMTRWHVDSGKQTLPVGDLPRGVYFVRHEASRSVKKLIIQ